MIDESIEELMKPRYLVIADDPARELTKGQVLIFLKDFMHRKGGRPGSETFSDVFKAGNSLVFDYEIDRYPDFFRKLDWHELRTNDEMPKYVKRVYHGEAFYYEKEIVDGCMKYKCLNHNHYLMTYIGYCTPINEPEIELK